MWCKVNWETCCGFNPLMVVDLGRPAAMLDMMVTATFDKINCGVAFGSLCGRSAGTYVYLACQEAWAVPVKAVVAPWFLLTIRGDEVPWPFRDGSNSLRRRCCLLNWPFAFGMRLREPAEGSWPLEDYAQRQRRCPSYLLWSWLGMVSDAIGVGDPWICQLCSLSRLSVISDRLLMSWDQTSVGSPY